MRSAVAWVSRTALFRRLGPVMMPPLERAVAALSGGRLQASSLVLPSLVLHSTGARSGLARDTVLMCAPERGGYLVAGSNFGRPDHPAWTANLLAHADAAVTVRGRRVPVQAELLAGAEREAAWKELEDGMPGFRDYERLAGRELRVFRLHLKQP